MVARKDEDFCILRLSNDYGEHMLFFIKPLE
jgi:hypothetical protein